jgi:uroporphyrinogen decarboxylase
VPIDFGGHRSSDIMVQAYKKLREALSLPPGKLYVFDFIQQLAIIEDDVLDLIGADVVELGHEFYKYDDYWQDWELEDGTPCKIPAFIEFEETDEGTIIRGDEGQVIAIKKKGCLYVEQNYFPLYDNDDRLFDNLSYYLDQIMWTKIGTPPAPAGFDEEGLKVWEETARNLRKSTDRAIYATFGGSLVELGEYAFRMDNYLMQLASDPERIHVFLDKVTEMHLENLEKFLGAVGDYVDIIGFGGEDLGMQTGPLLSPHMYREFFKFRHQKIWGRAKELCPHLKISLHSCGSINLLLEDLIEAGLEVVNPVQISAYGMDLKILKEKFGDRLTFWV